jgi:hypothetical protein
MPWLKLHKIESDVSPIDFYQTSLAMNYQMRKAKCACQGKLMTQDDVDGYGEELIDLAKRAAQEAMRPELNALRQELLSKLAAVGSDKTRVAPPPLTRLITSEDVDGYGEELIDLAKRAAQEAMRPELNALRQELLSEIPAAAGERSGPKISVQTGPVPARVSECGPGVEKSIDLKTTVMFTGLATSFLNDAFVYVVSTIYRKDLGGLYQTSILKYQSPRSGFRPDVVYRIEVASQLKSVREHIDTVRMALTNPENTWEGTKDYQDDLMNEFSSESNRQERPREMSWTDKRIKMLIMAANINYEPGFFSRLFSGSAP